MKKSKPEVIDEDNLQNIIRDAERYRFIRNNTSVMLFEIQKWKNSHKLDWAIDELMEKAANGRL